MYISYSILSLTVNMQMFTTFVEACSCSLPNINTSSLNHTFTEIAVPHFNSRFNIKYNATYLHSFLVCFFVSFYVDCVFFVLSCFKASTWYHGSKQLFRAAFVKICLECSLLPMLVTCIRVLKVRGRGY